MELKRCSKCGIEKELSEFNNRKSSSDGLNNQCRECCNIDKRKYRKNNPDKVRESKRRYRKNNPDKVKESKRRYRENNPDKVKESDWVKIKDRQFKVETNKYSTIVWYYPKKPFILINSVKVKMTRKEKEIIIRESLIESTCNKCGVTKPISEFYKGSILKCGECEKERQRIYRLDHPIKVNSTKKKYRENNTVKIKEGRKIYRKNNPNKGREYSKLRRKKDPFYRAIHNLRNRTTRYLKQIGVKKDSPMFKMIGCTPEEFRKYLENRFLEGMSWDNYGFYVWHIDHIIPISSAKTIEDIKRLCHYTNFQPLWAEDNLKKSNQITTEGRLKQQFPYNEISVDKDGDTVTVKISNDKSEKYIISPFAC